MTAEELKGLRALVNEAQHERFKADTPRACTSCGGSWESVTWDCTACRERLKTRHRRELRARDDRIRTLVELLDEREAVIGRLRGDLNRDRAAHQRKVAELEALIDRLRPVAVVRTKYDTDEERAEARRRSWRDSQRRRYRARKRAEEAAA